VPSLSGEEAPHTIVMTQVPVYPTNASINERVKRIGYDLVTSDDCTRYTFSEDKFSRLIKPAFGRGERKRSENELDHHSVFVMEAGSEELSREYPDLAIDNPFPQLPVELEKHVEVAFNRIMVRRDSTPERMMLWESVALMQIYTMMAIGYINSQERLVRATE